VIPQPRTAPTPRLRSSRALPCPRARARRRAIVVGAGLLAALAAPPASASYVAAGSDPANDAATPHGGHDIVGVVMVHDPRTGTLRAQVRLRGAPADEVPANLTVFAGHRTPTGCSGYPAIGFGTLDVARGADWVRLDAAGAPPRHGDASKQGGGETVQEFESTEGAFRNQRPNCVVATTADPENVQSVYDQAGPFALRATAGLTAEIGKAPTMRPGRTRTIRVVLRNPGHAKTGRIRLSVPGARGMRVSHPRRLGSIAGGKRRTVALRVTLSSRAKPTTKLRVKVTAPRKLSAAAETSLRLIRPSSGAGGGGNGSGDGPKLCYRYTWYPPYGELQIC
jgi:hypothetical protein